MKYFKYVIIFTQLLGFMACTPNVEELKPAPEFKTSIPQSNATGVLLSTDIEVVFDEVVSLSKNHVVTINDEPANVESLFTKLVFTIDLDYETNYNIIIPRGAVINTFGVQTENEIKVSFTTEDAPVLAGKDPNFHIYLCFGQSNMQGAGAIEEQDKTVDSRFQVMQSLDCTNPERIKGEWRDANPPLCQCNSGLSPADYFGRTMVENLPDNITVGVINVAVAGSDIRLFDKDKYLDYNFRADVNWYNNIVNNYNVNPYEYLINLAKGAQQNGVIKGVLLHQGETNSGDQEWPSYVKKIYNDMLVDLSLPEDALPLLAGELVSVDDNCCASMNTIINKLPNTIPNAHIISSDGCTAQDKAHFDPAGYRELGKRYATKMLSLLED